MDQTIITEKLESLRRCIKRIEDKKHSLDDFRRFASEISHYAQV